MRKYILLIILTAIILTESNYKIFTGILVKVFAVVVAQEKNIQEPTGKSLLLEICLDKPVAVTDEKFLSVSIDTSQLVGGNWWSPEAGREDRVGARRVKPFDFSNPRLRTLARELAPAYLRIGGTEADKVYYEMNESHEKPESRKEPPGDYEFIMTKKQWDSVNEFCRSVGFSLFFTANAGPGPRDDNGVWTDDNLKELLVYSRQAGYNVPVWELGNELNVYWYIHGFRNFVREERYADDFSLFGKTVKEYFPDSMFAGPSTLVWPVVGEMISLKLWKMEDFIKNADNVIDIITWHYYPQQSRRCSVAVRRASPETLLNLHHADEIERWASEIMKLQQRYAPRASVWMGETGNAQAGGEPDVSDKYVSGLWWLDQLGILANNNHRVVIRQTLTGSNYGMLDEETLDPNPDYWNSLLWKKLMGQRIYKVRRSSDNDYVRAYAVNTPPGSRFPHGSCSVLLINLNKDNKASVHFKNFNLQKAVIYKCDSDSLTSKDLFINNRKITMEGGNVPDIIALGKKMTANQIILKPASYSFIVFTDL